MKKINKYIKITSLLSFSPILLIPTNSINPSSQLIDNSQKNNIEKSNLSMVSMPDESVLESEQKWIDSIKESMNANTVKLFFTRNASLVFQQSLIVIQSILNNKNLDLTNKPFQNEIGFFIDDDIIENTKKFNLSQLESLENVFVASKLSDFNKKSINANITNDEKYSVVPSEVFLDNTIAYYKNKFANKNIKFDLWIPDLSMASLWNSKNKGLLNILPYVNKIYLLSDGNAQTYQIANGYIDAMKKTFNDDKRIIYDFSTIINESIDYGTRYSRYYYSNFYEFMRLNIFTIFHIDRYVDSPFYKINKSKMYTSYLLNYDYSDMATKMFDDIESQNQMILGYEKFFMIENNSLENFVYEGFENYDPKKKNIIWMGDSLIRSSADVSEKRKNEIQDFFKVFYQNHHHTKYNFFFKHHPYYSTEHQKQLTNFITAKAEGIKPIYFKNFPWELFLSWDKRQQSNNEYVPFFSSKTNIDEIPQTQFVGVQYTSSVMISTNAFNIKQHKMSLEQSWKTINNNNFPIGGTYDMVSRSDPVKENYNEQVDINIGRIHKVYDPFLNLNKFPFMIENMKSINNYIDLNKDIFDTPLEEIENNENTKPENPGNGNNLESNDNQQSYYDKELALKISVPITLLLVGCITTGIIVHRMNNKKRSKKIKLKK